MKPFFAIISCHKNRHRRDAIRKTWLGDIGERADYKFFVGNGDTELEEDVVKLEVADDYKNLPHKVRAVLQWVLNQDYKDILKVDDDVYVFPERILACMGKGDYVGRWASASSAVCPKGFISGFAYWLTESSARIMANTEPDLNITASEDCWTGRVLSEHGIIATHDQRFMVISIIARQMWHSFSRQGAAFAQFESGLMQHFDAIAKGRIQEPELPTTGRNLQLVDPRTGRQFRIGYIHRKGR